MLSNRNLTHDEFMELATPLFDALATTAEDVYSLTLDSSGIKVTVFRRDSAGKRFVPRSPLPGAHDGFVKDTYFLAVEPSRCDDPDALCNPRKSTGPHLHIEVDRGDDEFRRGMRRATEEGDQ